MWERESNMNLEAIEEAQEDFIEVIKDSTSTPDIVAEAKEYYDQLEESKTYYRWLDDLVASIRSGEIFEFLPTDQQD
jgi:HTH-type transcriptional regulator, glycine betaine synthesis regulator